MTCRIWFSPSSTRIPDIELRSSRLVTSAFTHRAYLLACILFFFLFKLLLHMYGHFTACGFLYHIPARLVGSEEGVGLLELGRQMVVGYPVNIGS